MAIAGLGSASTSWFYSPRLPKFMVTYPLGHEQTFFRCLFFLVFCILFSFFYTLESGHAADILMMANKTQLQDDTDLGAPQFAYHAVVEPIVRSNAFHIPEQDSPSAPHSVYHEV